MSLQTLECVGANVQMCLLTLDSVEISTQLQTQSLLVSIESEIPSVNRHIYRFASRDSVSVVVWRSMTVQMCLCVCLQKLDTESVDVNLQMCLQKLQTRNLQMCLQTHLHCHRSARHGICRCESVDSQEKQSLFAFKFSQLSIETHGTPDGISTRSG